ncbi:penicillin-binding protein 1B [Thioflexithrix psekupsensis]|uniref:Penicillin-binding protein 1B n=1 Tax=Thioflexithrix psekupsensis TaxID=1570016 RepID=A0A251XCG4_9GAMM|nr:penicillin-binding protein 1B [Thioflexithrix psekupsensis]
MRGTGRTRPSPSRWFIFRLRWVILVLLMVPVFSYVSVLDAEVREVFEGKRWALPARVYARPLEIYAGMKLPPALLAEELEAIGYKKNQALSEPGHYIRKGNTLVVRTREFQFWDGVEQSTELQICFNDDTVSELVNLREKRRLSLARIEPKLIGKIYPTHNEDRVLVKLDEVPPLLIQSLIASEDRQFFEHNGISMRGIARAFLQNIKQGAVVQGGSTITQQLVKNFYLSPERTLNRKMNEAMMSLLLEWHYSKEQILEAYLNEVFLGQDGSRAIHGVGLASWFYFNKPVGQLKLHEVALITSLIRGASQYNPRRNPDRAIQRRNLILDLMAQLNMIGSPDAELAKAEPLGVIEKPIDRNQSPYPAFLQLVRQQVQQDYRDEDLRSEGLQIFTTLDPVVQGMAEKAMSQGIARLERENRGSRNLQGAMLVTGSESGEILAMVNGKDSQFAGFNRPMEAQRQIGSLIKVAVYLAALEDFRTYSLVSTLKDMAYEWHNKNSREVWRPKNYDNREHGRVPLHYALANSFNLATVHLGMELGLDSIKKTLQRMGVERDFQMYPSTLLGSLELSPLEVTQMYQTLASGGFRVPLRAIRNVLTHDGKPLQRYALSVEQRFDSTVVFLLNHALQLAVREGTGRQVARNLPEDMVVSGKTGTSNSLRDSWFAGFDSQMLAVTWIGRDDNKPTGLSGSSGAMRVWREFIDNLAPRPYPPVEPSPLQWRWVDYKTGRWSTRGARGAVKLPFITDRLAGADNLMQNSAQSAFME